MINKYTTYHNNKCDLVSFMNYNKGESTFREKIAETYKVPKDVALGYSIISMVGNREVIIENYRGILEFSSESIRILCKLGQIKISGKKLNIEHYNNIEMRIVGSIEGIEYL